MRKSIVHPIFRMAFSDLEQLGDTCQSLMVRDAVPLLTYGVDAARLTLVNTLTDDLKNCPTDEELKAAVGIAVEKRDEKADEVKVSIREIMIRAKSGYGEHTSEYRAFGTKAMDDLTASDLCRCARRVVRVASLCLADLSSKGLTQAMIDDLETKNQAFDSRIDAKIDADHARDGATSARVKKGNNLYVEISEIYDYGKNYWVTRDEAMYNDYVIYNTPDMKKPEPGQYGTVHGTMYKTGTTEVPANSLIFFDGVEVPIEVEEDGTWEFDQVPVTAKKIRATADDCADFEADIEVLADSETEFDIDIDPLDDTQPS
jgi:hypothetical protein